MSCVMRHVSCVVCLVSCVLCHAACVMRHVSCVIPRSACASFEFLVIVLSGHTVCESVRKPCACVCECEEAMCVSE